MTKPNICIKCNKPFKQTDSFICSDCGQKAVIMALPENTFNRICYKLESQQKPLTTNNIYTTFQESLKAQQFNKNFNR